MQVLGPRRHADPRLERESSCLRGRAQPTPQAGDAGRRTAVQAGVTLLELMVALTLSAMIVLAAVQLLAGSRAGRVSGDRASDAVLTLDLAADLLAAEVRRAGFVPPAAAALADALPAAPLSAEIHTARAAGDSISVAYLDDRLAGGVLPRALRFEAGVDGRGAPQLYRVTASGARQPLVEGVTRVTVAAWADATGLHGRDALTSGPFEPWLLLLRIRGAAAASRLVAVALPNRPSGIVEVGP